MSSHTYFRGVLSMAGLACGAIISSTAMAGAPKLEVVAYSGLDNSPPNFPGLFWNLSSGMSNPVIDNSGNIAFQGTLFGDGIIPANNRVIWYGGPSGWTNIARNGNRALPGLPGLSLLAVSNIYPPLAPNGKMLVASSLSGGGVTTANDTAFWYGPIGAFDLIARESTTVAPNTGGAVMTSSFGSLTLGNNVRMNNAGQVLFTSNLSGGSPAVTAANNFGLYIGSASGVVEAARKGNPIPGAPALPDPSGPFMTPDSFGLFMNGSGEIASTGTLVAGTAGGVTTNDDKVVYTTVGGSMRLVAREGSPVPPLTLVKYKSTGFFSVGTTMITNPGKVLYNATLDNIAPGTSVTAANDNCWLVDDHGTVSVAVREGDIIGGETFSFGQGMFLDNGDRLTIVGGITPATNSGRIWTGPLGGPYTKIVEQGVTTAPGDPSVILNFSPSSANAAVNNVGQIVFSSALTGPGVTPGLDDVAIFGWDPTSGLVMIARKAVTSIPGILETSQLVLIGGTGVTGENGSEILTDNGWFVLRLQDVKGFQAIVRTKPFAMCAADATGNGVVNIDDLVLVITHWGATGSDPADVNGDHIVNIDDLVAVITGWGFCP